MSEKLISEKWLRDYLDDYDTKVLEPAALQMLNNFHAALIEAPAADAVELSRKELGHLINDTIAYIWRLEDRGLDNSESGYDSRKALLEKLQRFEKEHFPEMACCCGERREENAID